MGNIHESHGLLKGNNLFHSFDVFNVHKGETAMFHGSSGIQHILSRVTGENPSWINGSITSEISGADLYLLNSSGIIFGPDASINIDSSFHVSTADYLQFGGPGIFYSSISNTSILTSDTPAAFGFIDQYKGEILFEETNITVSDNHSIEIMADQITVKNSSISAPGGDIYLKGGKLVDINGSNIMTRSNLSEKPGNIVKATDYAGNVSISEVSFVYKPPRSKTTINCILSQKILTFGNSITARGQVIIDPSAPGDELIHSIDNIDIKLVGPNNTQNIRTLANNEGKYAVTFSCNALNNEGKWSVKANWGGNEFLSPSSSDAQSFTVLKAATRVSLDVAYDQSNQNEPVNVINGKSISISGRFIPELHCNVDLNNIPISIVLMQKNELTKSTEIITNNASGQFLLEDFKGFNNIGDWILSANFKGNNVFASSQSLTTTIRVVESAGYAIIVQGKIEGGAGSDSHKKTTDFVYNQFRNRGLLRTDIKYFNYENRDPDGGISDTPTLDGIEKAITKWAYDKLSNLSANLYIVLVDHGGPSDFEIFPNTIQDKVLSSRVNTLQDRLINNKAPLNDIIIILGFCHSGSFIKKLKGPHRIIITSAAEDEYSLKGPSQNENGTRDGEFFVSEFFKYVSYGKSIKQCFEYAVRRTETYAFSGRKGFNSVKAPYFDDAIQHPLLDDNGDGLGSNDLTLSGSDGIYSNDVYIGANQVSINNAPGDVSIIRVTDTFFIDHYNEIKAELWAELKNEDRCSSIWVEIKTPDCKLIDNIEGQQEYDLIWKGTTDRLEKNIYHWKPDIFITPGIYQIFYYAIDTNTKNISPVMESTVYKAKLGNEPPSDFLLISPADNADITPLYLNSSYRVLLDWKDSYDKDDLSYTVLLSDSESFQGTNTHVVKQENIKYSTYLFTLPDWSVYHDNAIFDIYWKVQAIDQYGAINETLPNKFRAYYINPAKPSSYIKCHVFNKSNSRLISNAKITAYDKNNISYSLHKESSGLFLGKLKPLPYTISVIAKGYHPKTMPLQIPPAVYQKYDIGLFPYGLVEAIHFTILKNFIDYSSNNLCNILAKLIF